MEKNSKKKEKRIKIKQHLRYQCFQGISSYNFPEGKDSFYVFCSSGMPLVSRRFLHAFGSFCGFDGRCIDGKILGGGLWKF